MLRIFFFKLINVFQKNIMNIKKTYFNIKNVIFFIVLRFFFKKKNFFFGNIINNISILGIIISISGLIISSSIMNGLDNKIISNILNLSSHINISVKKDINIKTKIPKFFFENNINRIIPMSEKKIIIYTDHNFDIGNLIIINKKNKFLFNKYQYSYYYSKFNNLKNEIFLNKNLAKSLNINLGDKFYLFFPKFKINNNFFYSKNYSFYFSGFFVSNSDFDQNEIILFYKNNNEKISNMIKKMSLKWKIWLKNPFLAQNFKDKYKNINFLITTWKDQEKELCSLIFLEKKISSFLFLLVFFIGVINILILTNLNIIEKEKDFSILLVLGIKKRDIFCIFFLQYLINCFLGLTLGSLLGILITKKINFFMKLIFSDMDLLTIKPIILISDISFFIKITIFFSFFSIIYPFFKVIKMKPIKVLSNE